MAGDTITVAAGQVAEVEFTVNVSQPNGPDIDPLFVASGANENGGNLFLVVSTSPIPQGVVLTPIADATGAARRMKTSSALQLARDHDANGRQVDRSSVRRR